MPGSFDDHILSSFWIIRALRIFFWKKQIQIIILGALKYEIIFALLKIKRKIDQRGLDPLELLQQFKLNDGGDTAIV